MKLIPGKLYVASRQLRFRNDAPYGQRIKYPTFFIEKDSIIMFVEYQMAPGELRDLKYGEPVFLVGKYRVVTCSDYFDHHPEEYLKEV